MEEQNYKSDEIDLRLIYRKIKIIFSDIGNFFATGFLKAKKRWKTIFLCFLFGIAAGAGLFFVIKPVFISSLTLSSALLRNDFCADLIEDLQLIVKDNTPQLLAEKLKLDLPAAAAIKSIEYRNYNEEIYKKYYKDKDTVVLGLPFTIKVYAYNNACFAEVHKALVNYLENNEYALKRKEIQKNTLKLLREKIQDEIVQLDSMKMEIASQSFELPRGRTQGGFVFGQPLDPINMYREVIALFQHELQLNKELILIDNIEVISEFATKIKPDSPKLWKTTSAGGVVGLFLGILLAVYLERKKPAR